MNCLPKVNNCCCGCTLRSGVNILAVIYLLGGCYELYSAATIVLFTTDTQGMVVQVATEGMRILAWITAVLYIFTGAMGCSSFSTIPKIKSLNFMVYGQLSMIFISLVSAIVSITNINELLDPANACSGCNESDDPSQCLQVCTSYLNSAKLLALIIAGAGVVIGVLFQLYFAVVVSSYVKELTQQENNLANGGGVQNAYATAVPVNNIAVTTTTTSNTYAAPQQYAPVAQPVAQYAQPVAQPVAQYGQPTQAQPPQYAQAQAAFPPVQKP